MTRDQLNGLRGLACLLLVANHVVGGTPQEGLKLASGWARVAVDALAAVRMPLFAVIAGMAHFHVRKAGWALWSDKAQRLLLPMLLTGTVFALLQSSFGGSGAAATDWRTLHLLPVAHYWFLESLFLIVVVWSLAPTLVAKAVLTGAAVVAYLLHWGTPWLGIAGAVYLAPYFALGWWWAHVRPDQPAQQPSRHLLLLTVLAVLALAGALGLVVNASNPADERMTAAMLMASTLACVGLLILRPQLPGLQCLGQLSYVVFLFHVFFTAPARRVLMALQVHEPAVHLLVGVLAAVVGSWLVRRLLVALGGPALWFMGARSAPASKPSQAVAAERASNSETTRSSVIRRWT